MIRLDGSGFQSLYSGASDPGKGLLSNMEMRSHGRGRPMSGSPVHLNHPDGNDDADKDHEGRSESEGPRLGSWRPNLRHSVPQRLLKI